MGESTTMQTILALVGVAFAYGIYLYISNLRHNISLAKKTGLPYVVTRMFATP